MRFLDGKARYGSEGSDAIMLLDISRYSKKKTAV